MGLVALVACQAPAAGHAPPADAGISAPDAPDSGGSAPDGPSRSAVTGRRHEICHQEPANVDIPVDLSMALVQAVVPDPGPTGYRVIGGRGGTDGSFMIPDVPDGVTFLLRIDSTYYATDQHVFDVRSERRVRCAPVLQLTNHAVTVSYDLTGMTPAVKGFEVSDWLDFASPALGYSSNDRPEVDSSDTTAAGSISWPGNFTPVPLVDAAAGDDLHVLHWRGETLHDPVTQRTRSVYRIIDAFDATGIALHEGMNSIAGAFQPATARTFSFSLDLARLDAEAGGHSQSSGGFNVFLFANPHGVSSGGAMLLFLGAASQPHGTASGAGVTDQPYGDPFPDAWTRSLYVEYIIERNFGTRQFPITFFARYLELRDLDVDPGPPLRAPSGVTVDGVDFDAGGPVRFDGVAPLTMRWDPTPGATAYRVTIPRGGPFEREIATFWTADTHLEIPASIFTTGVLAGVGYYVLVIDAVESPIDLATGHGLAEWTPSFETNEQLRLPGPIRIAGHVSGRFHFSVHCGDGATQPDQGEQCDTGGESATCNADCTVPVCGDGVRNAAAGEDCDTAGDSPTCNFNCTLPRCGDGHRNPLLEDCDDGNALDDSNGCSANCLFNNHCGNGILEDTAEQCDPGPAGDGPTCDADCTPAVCGDGYVNHAAGEQCDDPLSPQDCVQCQLP